MWRENIYFSLSQIACATLPRGALCPKTNYTNCRLLYTNDGDNGLLGILSCHINTYVSIYNIYVCARYTYSCLHETECIVKVFHLRPSAGCLTRSLFVNIFHTISMTMRLQFERVSGRPASKYKIRIYLLIELLNEI